MFTMRTTKPANNPFYNRPAQGGYNQCVQGQPTDWTATVLANCVGYSCGRFNEVYSELTGYDGMKYPEFWCNAEDFVEVAQKYGISYGATPKAGAIMCWEGIGSLAGHVAHVERVNSDGSVYTSESGWGGPAFFMATRYSNGGNWGMNGNYRFRAFIYNPAVTDIQPVPRDKYTNQIEITGEHVNVRKDAGLNAEVIGQAPKGYYNALETKEADEYKWYRIAGGQWIAFDDDWAKYYEAEERPDEVYYQVRDARYYVWFPNVTNDADYAGLYGDAVSGFRASLSKGHIKYTAHVVGKWWLEWVTDRNDYAGSTYRGQNIDGICVKADIPCKYRAHLLGGGWLPWVKTSDANINDARVGFAGVLGKVIDGIQVMPL